MKLPDAQVQNTGSEPNAILEIKGLRVHFHRRDRLIGRKTTIHAVDDVSLTIAEGETLSLVGESGSGKSTLARTVMKLNRPSDGTILFRGQDIFEYNREELKAFRRRVQMIFQDPYESLNPQSTVFNAVIEPRIIHGLAKDRNQRESIVSRMLTMVGLDPSSKLDRYPHELSGGERQRVAIARALSLEPELLVADEPVSMLDVSIRLGVLHLLQKLKEELKLTYLLITHDLGVARYIGTRIAVMYFGQIVELAETDELINHPMHHYTNLLLSSIPGSENPQPLAVAADVDYSYSAAQPPSGCRFRTRCPKAQERCALTEPKLTELLPGHFVACHYPLNA
jgi:oligopeptide/dipeptide ABC transporter ATP-binding protein